MQRKGEKMKGKEKKNSLQILDVEGGRFWGKKKK